MSRTPVRMNPFPGLRPFTQEEDYLFFGREEQTLELLQRLGSHRFVAVVGTSGSGKSSLVRCGLLSELLGGKMLGAGSAWEIAVTHPGGNPLALLTDALLDADLYDREEEHARENLLATLSRSHFGLVEAVKQAGIGSDTNFLLVVDQFEEIFRFQDAGQRQQEVANEFVSLLLEAVRQKDVPIYVVLTMRSDFIGECGQFEGLAEMVNRGEFLIPRLTREQYKRVIEGPIKVAGGQIAPRLLQRLLNDLGQQADQLPCLQHALMRTWDVWTARGDSEALDLDDYQRVGRMAEALSQHADEIHDSLASDHQRELCQGMFQALTVEESNSRGIRRPQRLGRLCQILEVPADELIPIIDAYRHRGVTFLMPSPDVELTDSTIIDISHESLMRVWTRLRQWVEEESQAAGIYHRLAESAALHEQNKAGLYRDPELGIALAWQQTKRPNAAWAERYRPGFDLAMAFLVESQRASVVEEQALEAARQRELAQAQELAEVQQLRLEQQQHAAGKLRKLIAGVAGVALIAGIACVLALAANDRARKLAVVASSEKDKAELNAKEAGQAKRGTELALIQVEAEKGRAEENLRKAELAEKRSREFRYSTDIELAARMVDDPTANATQLTSRLADFDPVQNKELAATDDLRGFEWYYLKNLMDSRASVFPGFNKPVIAAAVTAEGVLVTLDEEAQVRRFDVTTKQERGTQTDFRKGRNIVASTLSPDGQRVAIAIGTEVQIFDATNGEQIGRSIPAQVRGGIIFSPDSRMLITMDTGIGWWDAGSGRPIAVQDFQLTIFDKILQPLSASADGLMLAVGGQGTYRGAFSVFQLNSETREITRLLDKIGNQGTKRALAISSDGGMVAISLYFQGGIYVYETATGKLLQTQPSAHSSAISAIAFRQNNTELVTASLDGTIKVWNDFRKLDPDKASTFVGHAEEVNVLAILPGHMQLLSASSDKTVRVWSPGQGKTNLHQRLAGALGSPRASFSADGTLIATPGRLTGNAAGNRLRIWNAATGQPAMELSEGSRTDIIADSVAFSPDGRLLAAGYGGIKDVSYIELWDIDRRERIGMLQGSTAIPGFTTDENSGAIPGLAFSPNGKHLVAAFGSLNLMSRGDTGNFPLLVYDVANQQVIRRLEGHRNFCIAITFSRDGSRMASASQDGTARIWDTATWRELHILDNPDTASESGQRRVYDVAFSPNGAFLAMASAEGNVILFDVASGEMLQRLRGHANEVQGVAFAPDGFTLASGSIDGTLRFWNTATWRELLRLEPEKGFSPRSIAFSPDGDRLLACDHTGTLLWSIPREGRTSRTTIEQLTRLLGSKVDFRRRIRLLSDDLLLHEPLETLAQREPNLAEVQAALAATLAHWHADRSEWGKAVEQFDRLKLLSPETPMEWLRTPGLLRLATALSHEGRSTDAAALLIGGEARRAQDGNGTRSDSFGFAYDSSSNPAKLTHVFRGSPAWNGGLRVGDALLKINGIEVTSENRAEYQGAMQNPAEGKLTITFQHSDFNQSETAEITRSNHIQDDVTVQLIENLLVFVDQKLSESANDPGLLELRAELSGISTDHERQILDYTTAIVALSDRPENEAATDLDRLFRRRADACIASRKWQDALDHYSHIITVETTDEKVLSNQSRAAAEVALQSTMSILQPLEARSELGAALSVMEDGSVLATGSNPPNDRYRIVLTVQTDIALKALLLEALTHPSLPGNGPGRYPGGSFALTSLVVTSTPPDGKQPLTLTFDKVSDNRRSAAFPIGLNHWNIGGDAGVVASTGEDLTSVWSIANPVPLTAGTTLTCEMKFKEWQGVGENLGRFRLSVANDSPVPEQAWKYLAALKMNDPWQKLASAYQIGGDQQAIDRLVARRPQAAGVIGDLFIQAEDKNWTRAVEIYSQGITPQTTDAELFRRRAEAYEGLQDWNAAAADWERATRSNPDGARTHIEFMQRLANASQPALAMAERDRALLLLEAALSADPENVIAVEQMAGLLLERDQRLEFGLASLKQDAMTRITALRVETSSVASPPAGNALPFTEYQILSTKLPSQGFVGRFVRLDLPGESGQFPRFTKDGEKKNINLSELQIFQADLNIALNKKATASSGEGDYAPQRAVDGNTDGNDSTHSYAHTWDTENPWWEVDLGSEQAFDRMIVWNRSDVELYPRMNHFRVQILNANRELVYERVIDGAPAPSTEIRRSVNWSQLAATDAAESSLSQLTFGLDKNSEPPARLRVSATAELLSETTAERPNDAVWVEIPNALTTQSTGSLGLDAQTLAKIADQSRFAQATKIVDAPTRLAAAYELARKPVAAAEQFGRALDRSRTGIEREAALKELPNYPEALAELIQQRAGDPQLQIALARRHMAMGQNELEARKPNAALAELQKARDLFERLRLQNPEPGWTVLEPTRMQSKEGATLTLKDDGSVFVSGKLQVKDTFTFDVSGYPAGVTAVRLEALRDESLPNAGPGTHVSGNFVLSEFQVFAGSKADIQSAIRVELDAAFASFEERLVKNSLSPGELGWSVLRGGSNQTAVFKLVEPRSLFGNDAMRIVLNFSHEPEGGGSALLGHFRLSVATEPIDDNSFRLYNLKDSELAALDVGIGKALAQLNKTHEAAAAFARALNRVEDENEQKSLIELFQNDEAVLSLVAEQRPQDLALQLALAKRLAESGQAALASNRQDEALPQLTRARELFASLAEKNPEPQWTVLQPTEVKSAGGATLTVEADGSILASGANPANEIFTIVAAPVMSEITAVRLEALPHASLPKGGSGRDPNGAFLLTEFTISVANSDKPSESSLSPLLISDALAGFHRKDGYEHPIANALDGLPSAWDTWPEVYRRQWAFFGIGQQSEPLTGKSLVIRLQCDGRSLGCFRLSVSADTDAIRKARVNQAVEASGLSNLDASFATAYAEEDRLDEAAGSYARVLDLAMDLQARAKSISEAASHPGLLEKLTLLKQEDAPFLDALARHYQQQGELLLARDAAMKARAFYEAKLVAQPHDSKLAGEIADLLIWSSPQEWNVLEPTELQSAGGAGLTLLSDGSILASGNNVSGDTYTLVADGNQDIAVLRLEVLPDDSLPHKGPGRHLTGNFQLKSIRLFRSSRNMIEDRLPIPLQNAVASFAYSANDADIRGTIDDSLHKVWHVWGRFGEPHVAQYLLQQPVALQDGEKLTIVLEHNNYGDVLNLGRFRVSTSSDSGLFDAEKRRNELEQYGSAWVRLAAAYQLVGEPGKALATLRNAMELAANDSAKVALAQEAAKSEELFAQLLQQSPDDKWLRLGQARYQGKKLLATGRSADAIQAVTSAIETAPDDIDLLNQRAGACMKLAQWQAAAADYAHILELDTEHGRRREAESLLAEAQLRGGNFRTGADGYFERMLLIPNDEWAIRDACTAQLLAGSSGLSKAVVRRFFEKSKTSKNKDVAQWLVRIHIASPGIITKENSPELLEAARVAESPWTEPMTAAIHYRLGDLSRAEALLTRTTDDLQLQALGAMLLYDQGRTDEARALLSNVSTSLDRERSHDPGSVIPRQQSCPTWAVNLMAGREAARKLIGPRIAVLDASLAKTPDNAPDLLERVRLLTDAGFHEDALRDLDRLGTLGTDSLEASALYGRVLAGLNRDEEALPLLNQAVDAGSQDARIYAARGTIFQKQGKTELSQSDIQKSLELKPNEAAASSLADLLLAGLEKKLEWTILKPVEMKSKGGATLTLQNDGSILAGGPNTLGDLYSVTAEIIEPVRVTAIRLEALTDPSLPNNGPGRDENRDIGNFEMVDFQATTWVPGSEVLKVPLSRATASHLNHIAVTVRNWNGAGGTGRPQTAWYELESPLEMEPRSRLNFEMQFSPNSEWPLQNLGRFRVSVSSDATAFDRERMRLSAMKLTNPWAKLAAAYGILGDQSAVSQLLEQHPEITIGLADLAADAKDWDSAIAAYNRLITLKMTDVTLLAKRAAAYIATEQWELAKADWMRVIAQQPDQLQLAFETFRNAERWTEAAEFGRMLIDQHPKNTMLWVQVSPVAVLTDDEAVYEQLCRRVLELYREAPTAESVDRAVKACLLRRGAIDVSELPLDTLPTSLDSTAPDWLPGWFWGTRAMLAYRSGDADLAVQYVNQSEQHKPTDYAHALNLAILAMAQHELQHPNEAHDAVEEAAQVIERLRTGDRNHHDLLIAEILLQEAEALLKEQTKESDSKEK
jgi:WD40 repeat protein/Flp pilus assembly protein TadD